MVIRAYVQSEYLREVKLVELDEHATLHDLKHAALLTLPPGSEVDDLSMSIESSDTEIEEEIEDDHGGGHPEQVHVRDLKTPHGVRVHLHRCKHVDVYVRFGNETVHRKVRPATTVGQVRTWAGRKLGMDAGDVAEHVLQVSGSTEQPDVDQHIGTLARCPQCAVSFDLVPAHRING